MNAIDTQLKKLERVVNVKKTIRLKHGGSLSK